MEDRGTKNIECFTRALQLRWEWFRWDEGDGPWKGSATPCDDTDRQFVLQLHQHSVGDGSIARFWKDRWLDGEAPNTVAPKLFQLARFKKVRVKVGLHNGRLDSRAPKNGQ